MENEPSSYVFTEQNQLKFKKKRNFTRGPWWTIWTKFRILIETSKSKCLSFSNWCVKSMFEGRSSSNGLFTDQVEFLKMFDFAVSMKIRNLFKLSFRMKPGKLRFFLNFSWFCSVKTSLDGSFSNFLYFVEIQQNRKFVFLTNFRLKIMLFFIWPEISKHWLDCLIPKYGNAK